MKATFPVYSEDAFQVVTDAMMSAAKGYDGDIFGRCSQLPSSFALHTVVGQEYDGTLYVETGDSTIDENFGDCKKETFSIMRKYITDKRYVNRWRRELVMCIYDAMKGVPRDKLEKKYGKQYVFLGVGTPLDPVLAESKRIATEELERLKLDWTKEHNQLRTQFDAEMKATVQKWEAIFKEHKDSSERKIKEAEQALQSIKTKEAKRRTDEMMEAFKEGEAE